MHQGNLEQAVKQVEDVKEVATQQWINEAKSRLAVEQALTVATAHTNTLIKSSAASSSKWSDIVHPLL